MKTPCFLVVFVILMFGASSPVAAQLKLPKLSGGDSSKEDKQEKKDEKRKAKRERASAKNRQRYEKLKAFSLERYESDPEFQNEVEEEYEKLMRYHSARAYQKNLGRRSRIMTVHEDNWRMHATLYDNLLVQDHINRLGQQLVPEDSEKAYAFKVIPDPIPLAETLSTGTIYVSTGLIAMLETEAQLAYVLAHEMAHVHYDHWRDRVMLEVGQDAYAEEQKKKTKRLALIGTIAGAAVGGAIGQSAQSALTGAAAGAVASTVTGYIVNRPLIVDWDQAQEDAADELAFETLLKVRYDVREIPRLYLAMDEHASHDRRVSLGFLGDRDRLDQRIAKAKDLIERAHKAEIEAQLTTGFRSSSAKHRNLMAELKRDNGIMAYYHDMFSIARANLSEAVSIRDNDPAAHYFYGKVLKLVGRGEEDLRLAREEFYKATRVDFRGQNFGAHLHLALMLAQEQDYDRNQVAQELNTYVTSYAHWKAEQAVMGAFPPNLDSVYEYMSVFGDSGWRPPVPDLDDLPEYRVLNMLVDAGEEQSPEFITTVAPEEPSPEEGLQ
jgi:Zn-dependent protease with chaperone function